MKSLKILKGSFILATFLTLLLSLNFINNAEADNNPLLFLDPSDEKMALMGEEVVFSVRAIKQGDPAAVLTYSATGLPEGAIFDTSTQIFSWKPISDYDKKTHELKFTVSDGINTAEKTIFLSILTISEKTALSATEQSYWDNVRAAKGSPMTISIQDLPAFSDNAFLYQPANYVDFIITERLLRDGNKALFLNNLATLQEFQITDGLSEPGNTAIIKNDIVYDDNGTAGRQTYKASFAISPVIESVTINVGADETITTDIKGRRFGDAQGTSKILYNDTEVANPNWSDTKITCALSGITAGEDIDIKIITEGGESNIKTIHINATARPAAPKNLTGTVSGTQVDLNWEAEKLNDVITAFKIERKKSGDSSWTEIANVPGTQLTYTDTGLTSGASYEYRVRALNEIGYSGYSNTISVRVPVLPAAPSGLSGHAMSSSLIRLMWQDNSNNEIGFKVECSQQDDAHFTQITVVNRNTVFYDDARLTPETTYYYRVRAYNAEGDSAYSDVVSVKTLASPPTAPSALTATPLSTTQIELSWQDNSNNETGFKIERSENYSSGYNQIGAVAANIINYADSGLTPGKTYYYRVRAYNSQGNSGYSPTSYATTFAIMPPDGLTATLVSQENKIKLTWQDRSDNEIGFKIEQSRYPDRLFEQIAQVRSVNLDYSTGSPVYYFYVSRPNTTFYYRVRAYNNVTNSNYSNVASVTTGTGLPAAPTNLGAGTNSNNRDKVYLSWQDNSQIEIGFKIERARKSAGDFIQIAQVRTEDLTYSLGALHYIDNSNLDSSTFYDYRVRAYNDNGDSDYSNVASVETLPGIPAAPTNLIAQAVSSSKINLTWQDNSRCESGYKIKRSTNSANGFIEVASVGMDITTYSDTGLRANTTYYYRVYAYNDYGTRYSNTAQATTPNVVIPVAPEGLTATAISGSQIDLSWQYTSIDVDGFKLEATEPSNPGVFRQIATLEPEKRAFSHIGLTANSTYTYRIKAFNQAGDSSTSNTASARTLAEPPNKPSDLIASAVSSNSIMLSWVDNSENETGFKIERSLSATSGFSQVGTVPANELESSGYTDSGLTGNTTYYYRVCAFNTAGNSPYTNIASATTFPNPPATPSGLTAQGVSPTQISLTWQDNSNNETGFKIERSLDGATFNRIGTVGSNTTNYTDTGLNDEATYYYRVVAYNAGGDSAYSGVVSARTLSNLPAAPSGLTARLVSPSQISLSWQDNSVNETGFKIERSETPTYEGFTQIGTVLADVTTYIDTTFTSGRTYNYRIRAYNDYGNSDYSDLSAPCTAFPIVTPTDFTATLVSQENIVRLTWQDRSDNEVGFKIERWPLNDYQGGEIARVRSADLDYSAGFPVYYLYESSSSTGANPYSTYNYRIRAYNDTGVSGYANVVSVTLGSGVPMAPTNLVASLTSDNKVYLTWQDNSQIESRFVIYRSQNPLGFRTEDYMGSVGSNITNYTDNIRLIPGATYYYVVNAVSPDGAARSNVVSIIIPAATTPPAAPSGLTAQAVSSSQINLTWQDNANNETGFRIIRGPRDFSRPFRVIATLGANVSSYSDTGLTSGTGYAYLVQAYNSAGNSGYSNYAFANTNQ